MDRIRERWRTLAICGLLGVIVCGAYWPVVHNGFVQYDDADYVTENVHVLSGLSWENVGWAFGTGFAANWHPLTWVTHMLDCQLYGLNPTGHHLTNLALHVANAILLFLFFRRTTGALWRSGFVAALFALHPLHVESVAWVAERKDVLSGFFFLLTLLAYAAYAARIEDGGERLEREGTKSRVSRVPAHGQSPMADGKGQMAEGKGGTTKDEGQRAKDKGQKTKGKGYYALALLFLACGLMSKPMVVTTPFVLLLLDWWPLGRWQLTPPAPKGSRLRQALPLVLEKVPFFALVAGASLVTFLVQDQGHATALGLPAGPRVANAIVSYLKYLGHTAWPVGLIPFYPHPDLLYPVSTQWPLWGIALTALLLAAVSGLAFRSAKRAPWLATGWCWYLGMLVPVIGLVQVGGQALADRYTYLPLIGIFVCMAWGAAEWWGQRNPGRAVLATAGLAAVAACGTLTYTQAGYWHNNSTLWSHTLAVSPTNPLANYNIGSELARAGQFELALPYLQTAVEANPRDTEAQSALAMALAGLGRYPEAVAACHKALELRPWNAMAHNSLGTILWLQGKREEAKQEYGEALRCKPGYAEAYYSLGMAALSEHQLPEALQQLTEAVRHKPQSPEFRLALGQALAVGGRLPEAQAELTEALRLSPTNTVAQLALGNTLMEAGQTNQAAGCFAAAQRLDPGLAQKSLQEAKTLLSQGQGLLALGRFLTVARLQPDNAEAQENLGLLYAQVGKLDEAVEHFQERLRLQPDAQAWYNLALARVMQGKAAEAATAYQHALELKPDWPQALNDLAWLRATTGAPELRNGAEAVRLAERACELSGGKEPSYWGTLDAAYAEAGRFTEAISTATKARELALTAGQSNIVQAADQRLELYRKNQPYRQ